jgi:cytochrome c biogenesis protein CcmG/thiol:disulfide interchange protein DsbE
MRLATNTAARTGLAVSLLLLVTTVAASSPKKNETAPQSIAVLDSVTSDSLVASGHVVYLDFWASWCIPCRESFPWMNALLDKYRDKGLQVITVNLDKDPAAARKFMKAMNSTLPVVFDSAGSLAKLYNLEVMPTSFVYGRDGRLRTRHAGFHPKDEGSLESLIVTCLEEKPAK